MRFRLTPLRAASTFTIFGTALATVLTSVPAQASISAADTGHSITMRSNTTATAHTVSPASPTRRVGAITGILDGAGGKPLTAACVVASGQGRSVLAVTTSDGRYTLNGLPAGSYTIRYSACAAGGAYADQWWGGAAWPNSPAKVSIAAGQERELATVTLRSMVPSGPALPPAIAKLKSASAIPGLSKQFVAANASGQASGGRGAIAGTVTGGGKPLSDVCVFAFGGGHAVTSKSGKYRIAKLRAKPYTVEFIPAGFCGKNTGNWLNQIYKGLNGPTFHGKPTRVLVKAGKTTSGIDAALKLGGEITGTVKSQAGATLSRVCVVAEGRQGKAFVEGFTSSNKHGGYVLHSLFPGKYTLVFLPRGCGNKGNFVPQWWKNSATQKHATKITVASGQTVRGIDGALRPGAVINGVVRGGSTHGALLKGICVFAVPRSENGFFYGYERAVTNSKGAYRLTGLTTGKYRLIYLRDCGNEGNFLEVTRTLSVIAGHVMNGVDTVLPVGAIIRGKVTDTHGHPVSGICVSVSSGHGFASAKTAADGTYAAIALPSGSYKVFFAGGCRSTGSFAPQYYRGQVNAGSADPVIATAGHVTANINATMQPGGTITGVATDSNGNRLNKLCVEVQSPSEAQEGYPFGSLQFTKDGLYTVQNLAPGDYAVNFGCFFGGKQLFASQWFRGRPDEGSSDFVSAPAGRVTSGVSAVMRSGGSIAGVVTSSAGQPVGGICVEVFIHGQPPAQTRFYGRTIAFTNKHGAYNLTHLAAAKYDVDFGCGENRFANQWYKGPASRASATPVTVANNTATTGINASLTAGGSISGTVTTGANHPASRICVEASDAQDVSFGEGFTNAQGHYTMKDLSSGNYQITFFDCTGGRGHVRLGAATLPAPVHLVAPHAVTASAEKLSPAGSISGTVLGGPGATPQAGVCVVAVPKGESSALGYSTTSSNGGYEISGLAPGTYKVYLGDPTCLFADNTFAPQWYQGKSSEATATGVKVVSDSDTAGVGATLGGDGTITGVVTSNAHKPVTGECVTASPVNPVPEPLFNAVPHPVVAVSSGSYVLTGLAPGKYTVEFSTGCGASGFRTQWWHNAGSAGKATVITVPASTTVNGINATLH
ncbi:MAG TPA: carboxypeptidase regulatory-like domain-containing protein [Streptosporangiaceae bacterium]|nr:carboxypeptidase regulatory-like domain-containing protein [Streptosporangiaceae bacterium]